MDNQWFSVAAAYFGNGADPLLAGIFGTNAPGINASAWEKLLMWPDHWRRRIRGRFEVRKPMAGMFNATNCAFPRRLWIERPFDEAWAAGGEDDEWARWALGQGYHFILDPKFTVRHSHGLGLRQLLAQQGYWKSLGVRAFSHERLAYRKDLSERIRELE